MKTSRTFLLTNLTQEWSWNTLDTFSLLPTYYSLVFVNLLDCELFIKEYALLSFLSFPILPPPACYRAVHNSIGPYCLHIQHKSCFQIHKDQVIESPHIGEFMVENQMILWAKELYLTMKKWMDTHKKSFKLFYELKAVKLTH